MAVLKNILEHKQAPFIKTPHHRESVTPDYFTMFLKIYFSCFWWAVNWL